MLQIYIENWLFNAQNMYIVQKSMFLIIIILFLIGQKRYTVKLNQTAILIEYKKCKQFNYNY